MIIQAQKQLKVLLIGDSCQDIYHFGSCDRISPEAPVLILKENRIETKYGMAANVRQNLVSFNIHVDFITNEEIIKKHRYIDEKSKHHLLRVDEGEIISLNPIKKLEIDNYDYDAIVISDYDKGFLRYDFCDWLTTKFSNIPIFVDSKKKDLSCFNNSYIKLNKKEYEELQKVNSSSELIVTLGAEGALYKNKIYATHNVEVHDVCGAGDIFLCGLLYCFLNTNNIESSIRYANKLASLSVSKFGTYVLTKEDLYDICF
jgi:bifunctional ADP-heptose synthase (sugar kinase/adenylyltransferase)